MDNLFRTQWLRGKKSTGPSAPQWHLYKLITPQLLIEPYHMRFSHNFQNHSQQILRSNLYFSFFFSRSDFFSCLWSEAVAHAESARHIDFSLLAKYLNQTRLGFRKFDFTEHRMICVRLE